MEGTFPLRTDLDVSRWQRGFIVLSHALTAVIIAAVPLPWGAAPFGVLLVVALGVREFRRLPPAALVVRLDATLTLLWRNGTAVEASLCNGGYVGGWVTAIVWREEGRWRRQSLLITPDMLAADAFRQLRVHLRYASSGNDQDAPLSQA